MQATTINIYDQQARNRRMTIAVMLGFGAFVAFLGFGVDVFLLGSISDEVFVPIGTVGGVLAGSLSAFWSLKGGAKAVLAGAGAQPVDPGDSRYQQLINVVDEMRIASGLPMPQVYVIPDPDPNAFATGTTPDTSVIAVTQGLLSTLNREELQGVIAHEMSHIRNYDMRLMTVVAALVGSVLVLSDMAARSMRFGGSSRSKNRSGGGAGTGILFVVWIIAIILAPLIGRMLAMMVSRRREYLADASAAELTRNPLGLASALEKLNNAVAPTTTIRKGSAHLCIVDPTGNVMNAKEGAVADLFGTHPPIELRIEALKQMAYEGAGNRIQNSEVRRHKS